MEQKEFEKYLNMKNSELQKLAISGKLSDELTYEQLMIFLRKHNAIIYINHVCKRQIKKDDILNIVLRDTTFNRKGRTLNSIYQARESAAHSVITTQEAFDEEILHVILHKFDDDRMMQKKLWDYLLKMKRLGRMANKNFDIKNFELAYPEDALLLELQ